MTFDSLVLCAVKSRRACDRQVWDDPDSYLRSIDAFALPEFVSNGYWCSVPFITACRPRYKLSMLGIRMLSQDVYNSVIDNQITEWYLNHP